MIRRRTLILAAGIVSLLVLGLLASRSVAVRRWLVAMVDRTPAPAAAASVTRLTATFDGLDEPRARIAVSLVPVVIGVAQPTDLAFLPGSPDALVVLGKGGQAVRVDVRDGRPIPWFQVEVATTSELGLLGIAFHPNFAQNGRFFVNATPSIAGRQAETAITEWWVDPSDPAAKPVQKSILLEVEQPYQNHNAGQLAIGPDGYLYVGLGDGGFRADPHGNGQNPSVLLGKMLRLDVDTEPGRARVPADNPFVGVPGTRPEIWALGLRNPWRFTFEPAGRMLVGDVGQDRFEEITWVARGDNLGWSIREADSCFEPATGCRTEGLRDPVWRYGRDDGVSVTGGVVATEPSPLQGRYVFGDFGSGRLWALDLSSGLEPATSVIALGRFDLNPSAFTRAPDGSVWVADFSAGAIFRITPDQPTSQ